MPDIIGTPVERVIPDGWHVARNDVVKKGDVLGADKEWIYPSATMLGTPTGSCGFIWHAMGHYLVIRRNAPEKPEPSVESLKAKVAELEAENEKLRGRIAHLGIQFDQYKAWNATAGKELKAKDAEIERLKVDVHKWSEANQANLARADAADAKMCSGFQAEVDRLKAHAEQLERDLKASQARFCVLTQEADRMAAKLVAVRKAMGGA